MPLLIDAKKEAKKKALLLSASRLFQTKGFAKTSISDIATDANIAKGTFYLYFRDKEDLLSHLNNTISVQILEGAYDHVQSCYEQDLFANACHFVDYIIDYFKSEPDVLRMLKRNFSWSNVETQMHDRQYPIVEKLLNMIKEDSSILHMSEDQIYKTLFIVTEMIGSVCYTAIIEHNPCTIDEIKPDLYRIVKAAFMPQNEV